MNRPLGLVVVALLLLSGCGFFDGWTVGASRGSGNMDIDSRLGSGDTDVNVVYAELTKDIGTRAEAADAQIETRHLIRQAVSVNARQTEGEIDSLRSDLAAERVLNAESLVRIEAAESERDELREAVQAHHDEAPVSPLEGGLVLTALVAWFKDWLWSHRPRRKKNGDS